MGIRGPRIPGEKRKYIFLTETTIFITLQHFPLSRIFFVTPNFDDFSFVEVNQHWAIRKTFIASNEVTSSGKVPDYDDVTGKLNPNRLDT